MTIKEGANNLREKEWRESMGRDIWGENRKKIM